MTKKKKRNRIFHSLSGKTEDRNNRLNFRTAKCQLSAQLLALAERETTYVEILAATVSIFTPKTCLTQETSATSGILGDWLDGRRAWESRCSTRALTERLRRS
jgi:hypothetical protein